MGTRKKAFPVPRAEPSVSKAQSPSAAPVLSFPSVAIQSRPFTSRAQLSGEPNHPFSDVLGFHVVLLSFGSPHLTIISHSDTVEVKSPFGSVISIICPDTFFARGFAGFTSPDLRLELFVSMTQTRPVLGSGSTSSGRSIGVASKRSPARRASIMTSAWELKPFSAVRGP